MCTFQTEHLTGWPFGASTVNKHILKLESLNYLKAIYLMMEETVSIKILFI